MRLVNIALVIMVASTCSAVPLLTPYDTNPAPFRGEERTTLQVWTFGTDDNGGAPDISVNLNGEAKISNLAAFDWVPEQLGHQGIRVIDNHAASGMVIHVDNFDLPNPSKKIWVQIVFNTGWPPSIKVLPNAGGANPEQRMTLVGVPESVDDWYMKATYELTLDKNPNHEIFRIIPVNWEAWIDEIIIETQCVPEPMTLTLLGMGGLLLLRKRR